MRHACSTTLLLLLAVACTAPAAWAQPFGSVTGPVQGYVDLGAKLVLTPDKDVGVKEYDKADGTKGYAYPFWSTSLVALWPKLCPAWAPTCPEFQPLDYTSGHLRLAVCLQYRCAAPAWIEQFQPTEAYATAWVGKWQVQDGGAAPVCGVTPQLQDVYPYPDACVGSCVAAYYKDLGVPQVVAAYPGTCRSGGIGGGVSPPGGGSDDIIASPPGSVGIIIASPPGSDDIIPSPPGGDGSRVGGGVTFFPPFNPLGGISPSPDDGISPSPGDSLDPLPGGVVTLPGDTISPSPDDGISPSPDDGLSPSPDDGLSPSPDDGLSPSPDDGLSPSPDDGLSPSPDDGLSPSPDDSISPSPDDSISPSPDDSLKFGPVVCTPGDRVCDGDKSCCGGDRCCDKSKVCMVKDRIFRDGVIRMDYECGDPICGGPGCNPAEGKHCCGMPGTGTPVCCEHKQVCCATWSGSTMVYSCQPEGAAC